MGYAANRRKEKMTLAGGLMIAIFTPQQRKQDPHSQHINVSSWKFQTRREKKEFPARHLEVASNQISTRSEGLGRARHDNLFTPCCSSAAESTNYSG